MTEISDISELKQALYKSFTWITRKTETYSDEDTRLPKFVDLQHKLAKALIDCEAIERNLKLPSERDKAAGKKELVSLLRKLKPETEDKKTLQVFKTWLETSD